MLNTKDLVAMISRCDLAALARESKVSRKTISRICAPSGEYAPNMRTAAKLIGAMSVLQKPKKPRKTAAKAEA
jgi:DNA-binding XRE family transcriptional regulator